ncbi:cell division protein ZapA [Bacillus niameyensis]|uniref:cell division protein ZapA n=1 Tax=Bacillus niameyensis TaxID=1522308 RepID=UPI0007866BA4|nr:cell division protein ZapA [Bacillus niameyensis]
MADKEKVRVSVMIYGKQYTISGTEPAEHVMKVAGTVDKKMREIYSVNPNLNTESLAVLTAVNSIHDYMKLQEEYHLLLKEFNRLKD